MAPVDITDDYYAILEVSQTATTVDIKKSYRRLAILLHPDKNKDKPNATASFQLLSRAYETLKDESSRRIYDIKWPHITKTYRTEQEKAKREADAAKAESEKSAKDKAAREAEEQKSKVTIEHLTTRKREFDSKIFEVKREINRIQSELKNIKTLEDKALAEERARNSWSTYLYSSVFKASEEPEGAKQERDLQRLQRGASRTIKEVELSRKEEKLKEWSALLSGVEKAIAVEVESRRARERQAEREKAEARRREEEKIWKKQQEEFMERGRANRAAAEARAARERAAAEALRRAAEERRKKEDEERRKREEKEAEERRKLWEQRQKEIEEQRKREAKQEEQRRKLMEKRKKEIEEERMREIRESKSLAEMMRKMNMDSEATSSGRSGMKTRATRNANAAASSSASCPHQGWWDKVQQGNLTCENCHMTRGWLLECPSCQTRACAGCRKTLQKRAGGSYEARPRVERHYTPRYEDNFDDDEYDAHNWYD